MRTMCAWTTMILVAVALASCGLVTAITETAERMPEMIESTKSAIASISTIVELLKQFITQIMAMFTDLKNSPAIEAVTTIFGSGEADAAVGTAAGAGGIWLMIRNFLSGKNKKEMANRIGKLEKANGNNGE